MTHASLFSGIGGAEIAAAQMGWSNLFHCEINPFGRRVLEYWYPNSTSYEDITKTDFAPWRGRIDVLTGGFPCQPFSLAGSRKGADDDRYLWPQMLRAIREIRPSWVVGENVAGILTMVQPGTEVEVGGGASLFGEDYRKRVLLRQQFTVDVICQDLEREGYSVQPFVIPACAVGAPHRRDRVWFIARRIASNPDLNRQRERAHQQVPFTERQRTSDYCACSQDGTPPHPDEYRSPSRAAGEGTERSRRGYLPQPEEWRDAPQRPDGLHGLPRDAANARSHQWEAYNIPGIPKVQTQVSGGTYEELPALRWEGFPTTQPVIRGGDDGLPFNVDDLSISFAKWRQESVKALGNAIVPQVAYEIFRAIQQVEDEATTSSTP